ncbi:MAG: response regulator [Bacteroidia bacterium]
MNKKSIYIVEDNQVYAKSLQTFIRSRFTGPLDIRLFSIGETCLLDMHNKPDVVIMDYYLNSKYEKADNGLNIINQIKTTRPDTNIIVLSAQENDAIISEAIKHCYCNYVQKDDGAFNKVEALLIEIFKEKNKRLAGLLPDPDNFHDN